MADAHTSRLCLQIIQSQFGPLTGTVASALLTHGRLTLSQIVRFSSLKPQTARAAILILIQHNILWHGFSNEEGETLEFNVDECLMRLRFGRFVWQAEELFGKAGGEIVQLILDHGKLRPGDILSRCTSGYAKDSVVYSQALHKLVAGSYIKCSSVLSHKSPSDRRMESEAAEKKKISGFPTAKQLREVLETVSAQMKREEEEEEKVGLKRKAKEQPTERSAKRKMTTATGDDTVVDETIFFRVNFDKFNVHIRNKLIEKAVKERFNEGAALVIKAALRVTEASQKKLSDHVSEAISVANIAMQLSDQDNLSAGLIYSSKKKPSHTTCIKDYLGMMSSADNPTPAGRAASFVSYGSSKVQVEFEIITKRLRRRVLEAVARERHGSEGVRIVRLLMDTGKMDEKQISKIVMMAAKDVRPLLSALSADSLISTQEVPRTADRNPTRTFYLWHVDTRKVYSVLIGNLYKTLYNIGLRRQSEKEDPMLKAVLEKRERSDVIDDESLLTTLDRTILNDWERREMKLTVLEERVEESVFILRDLVVFGMDDD